MTDLQRLILRGGEIRTRLNELGSLPELTDEQRTEIGTLRNEYGDVERRTAALTIAGDGDGGTGTGEIRERVALAGRANVGEIFTAALEHRSTEGAEAELQTELGLNAHQIPLEMLRQPVETRAVTPAPGNVGQTQAEIIPYVFPNACAAFLGVDMPTVGVGEQVFPVLSMKTGVHTPAENAAAAETTGSFDADVLSPSRIQASFFYSREDRARFAGMDSSLRMNLSDALSDGLDAQIVAGANGLLTGTNLANHNVTAVTTYALYRSQFGYGRVDGRYASGVGDVRIVMGSGTYGHASGVFRSRQCRGPRRNRGLDERDGRREGFRPRPGTHRHQPAEQHHQARDAAGHGGPDLGRRLAHRRRDHEGRNRADRHYRGHAPRGQDPPERRASTSKWRRSPSGGGPER